MYKRCTAFVGDTFMKTPEAKREAWKVLDLRTIDIHRG
jgi:hypothetical protein